MKLQVGRPTEHSSELSKMAPSRRLLVDYWAQTGGRDLGEATLRPGGCFSLRVKIPVINHPARGQVQGRKGRCGGVGKQRRWGIEDMSFHGKGRC